MSAINALTLVCGALLGLGLWSVVAVFPRMRAPSLADRVAPYIVDVSEGARAHVDRRRSDPLPLLGGMLGPIVRRTAEIIGALASSNHSVQRKLDQSGAVISVTRFRYEQLLWGLAAMALGVGFAIALMSRLPGALVFLIPIACGALGVVLRDAQLQRRARLRAARMAEELPTVLEFLSLSLSAGEGILDSLNRLARRGSGELSSEFHLTVNEVSMGIPLPAALAGCARRAQIPSLTRAIEQLIASLERGAPLAEVLRAQAQDSREDAKRALLESAGKKEVAMLVPLVFFILPLSVAFAIYPGIFVLQAGF